MSYGKQPAGAPLSAEDQRVGDLEKILGGGQSQKGDEQTSVPTGYNSYAEAIRKATALANAERGPEDQITPAQMQAIIWVQHKGDMDDFAKRKSQEAWEAKNPGKVKRPGKPYVPGLPKQPIPEYTQNDEWAEANPFKGGEPRPKRADPSKTVHMVPDNVVDVDVAPEMEPYARAPKAASLRWSFAPPVMQDSAPPDVDWNPVMKDIADTGGYTLGETPGDAPTKGYMISLPTGEERMPTDQVTPANQADYYKRHYDTLREDPDLYAGGWDEKGLFYNDISRNDQNLYRTVGDAVVDGQKGIYDLNNGTTIPTWDDPSTDRDDYNPLMTGWATAASLRERRIVAGVPQTLYRGLKLDVNLPDGADGAPSPELRRIMQTHGIDSPEFLDELMRHPAGTYWTGDRGMAEGVLNRGGGAPGVVIAADWDGNDEDALHGHMKELPASWGDMSMLQAPAAMREHNLKPGKGLRARSVQVRPSAQHPWTEILQGPVQLTARSNGWSADPEHLWS